MSKSTESHLVANSATSLLLLLEENVIDAMIAIEDMVLQRRASSANRNVHLKRKKRSVWMENFYAGYVHFHTKGL
jgi:hypothetical protein